MSEKDEQEKESVDESVFDEAEIVQDMPEEEAGPDSEEDFSDDVFEVQVPDESPKDRLERVGVKEKADGKTLTIKEVFHTRPRMRNQDGSVVEPKLTQAKDKKFYPGKLGIRFEEDNLVEYYPNFHYFVQEDGKVNMVAKVNRTGMSAVTKLFEKAVTQIGKPAEEISDKEFYEFLIGKKVLIKIDSGIYNKKPWFRNDIAKFV